MLETGDVDIALSAAITPEREKYALFSKSIYRVGHNIMFIKIADKHRFYDVTTLANLEGSQLKLGVLRGTSYSDEYELLLTNSWFTRNLIVLEDKARLAKMLLAGRIDAFLEPQTGGNVRINENPEYKAQIIEHSTITTLEEAKTHLMFSRKTITTDQVDKIDDAIQKLRSTEQYQALFAKYGLDSRFY